MKFLAKINVMPLKELLDPQGKTILQNLKNIDVDKSTDVRVGKRIEMTFEAGSKDEVETQVKRACEDLLTNRIVEFYDYQLESID